MSTDDRILYRQPRNSFYGTHSRQCTCGHCDPVTQKEATLRDLASRGLLTAEERAALHYGAANDSEIGPEIYPARRHCAQCGEEWPCSDSRRKDIRPDIRALHTVKPLPGKPYGGPGPKLYDFYVVRVNGDDLDTLAAETLEAALELAMPDDGDRIDYGTVQAPNAGVARLMQPETWRRYYMGREIRRIAKSFACVALLSFLALPAFGAEPCKINVNTATPEEIQLLTRTGEVLAGRIVAGRPLNAEKLDAVKGVGPSWLAVNGPHVAFSGPTTCTEKIRAPKVAAQSPKL